VGCISEQSLASTNSQDLRGCEVGCTSEQPLASINSQGGYAPMTCLVVKWVALRNNQWLLLTVNVGMHLWLAWLWSGPHFGTTIGSHWQSRWVCTYDLLGCEVGCTSEQPSASINSQGGHAHMTCLVVKWAALRNNHWLPLTVRVGMHLWLAWLWSGLHFGTTIGLH